MPHRHEYILFPICFVFLCVLSFLSSSSKRGVFEVHDAYAYSGEAHPTDSATPPPSTPTPTPPTCSIEDVQKCLDGSDKCFDGSQWKPFINDCDDHATDQAECLRGGGFDAQEWIVCGGERSGHRFVTVPTVDGDCVVDYGKCFPPNEDLLNFLNCRYGKSWEKIKPATGPDVTDDPAYCSNKNPNSWGACTDCCIKRANNAEPGNCGQYEDVIDQWYEDCRDNCPPIGTGVD